jgi:hypothetical protein
MCGMYLANVHQYDQSTNRHIRIVLLQLTAQNRCALVMMMS